MKDNIKNQYQNLKEGRQSISGIMESLKKLIPFKNLEPSNFNSEIYSSDDEESLEILINDILDKGLRTALEVVKVGNEDDARLQKYRIISGHRRYLAIKRIREMEGQEVFCEKIPCQLIEGEFSDEEQIEKIITANIQRVKTPIEIINEIKFLKKIVKNEIGSGLEKERQKKLNQYINKYLDLSSSQGRKYKLIAKNLNEDFLQLLENENITINDGYKIAKMTDEEQDNFIDEKIKELEVEDIKEIPKGEKIRVDEVKKEVMVDNLEEDKETLQDDTNIDHIEEVFEDELEETVEVLENKEDEESEEKIKINIISELKQNFNELSLIIENMGYEIEDKENSNKLMKLKSLYEDFINELEDVSKYEKFIDKLEDKLED